MKYTVTARFNVVPASNETAEQLDEHLNQVYEALLAMPLEDPDLGGSLTEHWVDVTMTIQAASPEGAQRIARRCIRTAIERAGGTLLELPDHRRPRRASPRRPVFDLESVGAELVSA